MALLMSSLVGCAAQSELEPAQADAALCADASAHVQACLPGEQISTPAACDALVAADVLATSCDELAQQTASASGKADGFGCSPWTWWLCGGSSDSGSSSSARSYDFWVSVETCYDDFCDAVTGGSTCARVTLETPEGEVVATANTNTRSNVRFEGVSVEDGEYVVRLWTSSGELAQQMDYTAGSLTMNDRVGAEQSLFLEGGDEPRRVRFYVDQEMQEQLAGCARVGGVVESTCEGATMEADDIEWGWFVRLEGFNDAGEYTQLTRPFATRGINQFHFGQVMPGTYTVSFVEMDIPEFARRNNPDYARLERLYATHREFAAHLAAARGDIGRDLALGPFAPAHQPSP